MKKFIFCLLLFSVAGTAFMNGQIIDYARFGIDTNNDPAPEGLKPGDKAPQFSGYDQTGAYIQSKELFKKGPVVLFFYRGKWCPVCSKYLDNYQDSIDILTGMGVNVIAVTPESIENVEQTVRLHNLTFTVIYDCQEQIMKDYNVMFDVTSDYQELIKKNLSVSIAENNGRDKAHLPVPAAFIINRDGIIVAVQFDPDYNNRASVKWMIRNLALAL